MNRPERRRLQRSILWHDPLVRRLVWLACAVAAALLLGLLTRP